MIIEVGAGVIIVAFVIGMVVRGRRNRRVRDLETLAANQQAHDALEAENNRNQAHNPELEQYKNGVNSPQNRFRL